MVQMQDATVEATAVAEFKARLRGELILPADDAYEQARRVWNGNIDRGPALIARCSGVADVIDAVNFARTHDLLVAVRGGGHNAAGHGTCEGGIVIDLSPMRGIRVDPAQRTVQVQAGVLRGELDRETRAFGLAVTGGMISNTGVAGLTLGGGLGWLMGKHGLSIDSLLAVDVLTADGTFRQANAEDNADLFWGLRGGGGNFGVATGFEFALQPVGPIVLGGMVPHPLAQAREVLQFYREFSSALPDEAEAHVALLSAPDGSPAVALLLGYNGPIEEGEPVLAPARSFGTPMLDLVQPMPYTVRNAMLDQAFGLHGVQRYWKSGFSSSFSDALIDALIEGAATFISPMTAIACFRIHGAATRVPRDETAFGLRQEQWDINVVSQWTEADESDRQIAWTRERWSRIVPLISGSAYVNHLAADDAPEKVRASYGANYDRLVDVKRQYDPTNLFRLNPNINPV